MKILHLASFNGNHGDRFNHNGFYSWFHECVPVNTEVTKVEIRDFYGKSDSFDENFLNQINSHDLLIIGGGNYFETWLDNTWSGTTLDLTPNYVSRIICPIFINSVGLDIAQGISKNARMNLPKLLKILGDNPNVFLSLRDDGSLANMHKLCEGAVPENLHILPDSGYLAITRSSIGTKPSQKKLVVNLASDMPHLRYGPPPAQSMENFAKKFARVLTGLLESKLIDEIVFTVHIINDLDIVAQVIMNIPEKYRRLRLRITSYRMDETGGNEILEEYASACLVLSTRFHGNVVSLGSGITVLGINTYPQIAGYFREWNNEERLISFASEKDCDESFTKITRILRDPENENVLSQELSLAIEGKSINVRSEFKKWFSQQNFRGKESNSPSRDFK